MKDDDQGEHIRGGVQVYCSYTCFLKFMDFYQCQSEFFTDGLSHVRCAFCRLFSDYSRYQTSFDHWLQNSVDRDYRQTWKVVRCISEYKCRQDSYF